MKILIVGAGAIGGITAAAMARAGEDVTLVVKYPDLAQSITRDGLELEGVCGSYRMRIPAVASPDALEGTFDLCLIVTKAYDMPQAARDALPRMRPDTLVVSMQNGICTDALAQVVGEERTVGCVVGWGATMLAPGKLRMTSSGEFLIGRMNGNTEGLEPLHRALSHAVPTRIVTDIHAQLYSKLIVNACITSLGVLSGLGLGEMLRRRDARDIFLAVVKEAVDVAAALKMDVPAYGGKLDYVRLMAGNGMLDRLRRHTMIRLVGIKYRRLKSSSLQSLKRGKPTEVDYFNGYIVRQGAALGVPTPVNAALTARIHEIEAGKRPSCPDNLGESDLHPYRL